VQPAECAAANSVVTHTATGRTLRYGELAADAAKIVLAKEPTIKTPDQYTFIGKPMPRIDVVHKIDGSAKFGIDAKIDGMVFAAINACPVPGGKLKSVDESVLSGVPNIVAVVKLADAVALPMFVYNIPPCVGICLTFETVSQFATHENICGIKDSAGDIVAYQKFLELRAARPDWTFLMGPEHLTAESVLMGGDGGVNGGANLHPQLFVSVYEAAARRDHDEIARLQSTIETLSAVYRVAGSGSSGYLRGLKCAMSVAGICSDDLAAPFRSVEKSDRAKIEAIVKSLKMAPVQKIASNA
jgi:hypothetical protein